MEPIPNPVAIADFRNEIALRSCLNSACRACDGCGRPIGLALVKYDLGLCAMFTCVRRRINYMNAQRAHRSPEGGYESGQG